MEKWVYIINSNCIDPLRENEFDEWYNNIHLPDVLETPGIVRATRYESREPTEGQGKFVAIYEIETEDIDKTMTALGENISRKRKQGGRWTKLLSVVSRSLCKQTAYRNV